MYRVTRFASSSLVNLFFFFSSRRRHTRYIGDWSSDVCSSDLPRSRDCVGQAQGHAAGVGATGVVATPERDHRGGRNAGAVAVRAPSVDSPGRGMSSFHPHLLDRRLRVARAVVWGVIGIMVAVFFRTQILEHGKYRLQSEQNRLRPIPLPAPRGIIMDRNGRMLAENVPGYTVSLLTGDDDSVRATLVRLAPFVKLDAAGIARVIGRSRRAPYLPVSVLGSAQLELVSALDERRLI